MFWPLEKVPTTIPLLPIATDCSWPAAKPFCESVLMVADPLVVANCVSAPVEVLKETLPSDWPSTVRPEMVTPDPLGDDSAPLELKVKLVPTLTQATPVPVAVVDVW